jgi:hypothetical protein
MTIHPHQHAKNQWVLGRNRVEVDAAAAFGDKRVRRFDFDAFWGGNKWVKGTRSALRFESETAALNYLVENLPRMEASSFLRGQLT